jgi:hypothetical protein
METNEHPTLYAIYNLSNNGIRYPVFDTLEEAKQKLELTIISFFNEQADDLNNTVEMLQRRIVELKREEELKNKPKPATKPAPRKAPAKKKEDTESVASSSGESSCESACDDEYVSMTVPQLEEELNKLNQKYKNKYDLLVEVRNSLKVVSFKIE